MPTPAELEEKALLEVVRDVKSAGFGRIVVEVANHQIVSMDEIYHHKTREIIERMSKT